MKLSPVDDNLLNLCDRGSVEILIVIIPTGCNAFCISALAL